MNRKAAWGWLAVGSAMMLFSVFGDRWWTGHSTGIGLREMSVCSSHDCATASLGEAAREYPAFVYSGLATYFAALAAVAAGLLAGVVSLAGASSRGPYSWVRIARSLYLLTIGGAIVFVMSEPRVPDFSLDVGAPLAIGGAIAGIVAMSMFARVAVAKRLG